MIVDHPIAVTLRRASPGRCNVASLGVKERAIALGSVVQ